MRRRWGRMFFCAPTNARCATNSTSPAAPRVSDRRALCKMVPLSPLPVRERCMTAFRIEPPCRLWPIGGGKLNGGSRRSISHSCLDMFVDVSSNQFCVRYSQVVVGVANDLQGSIRET